MLDSSLKKQVYFNIIHNVSEVAWLVKEDMVVAKIQATTVENMLKIINSNNKVVNNKEGMADRLMIMEILEIRMRMLTILIHNLNSLTRFSQEIYIHRQVF